ncbi:MAG: argininosuccinate lyase [Holophaga sp.]|jgi:argininosuccinate lyase
MAEALWAKDLPLDLQLHRFTVGEDPVIDLQLMPYDVVGSAAHARMLGETGLLPEGEARALVAALAGLRQEALEGRLKILPEEEDCHTALEHALTDRLGDTGKRIHLARSRNDQVATALRLLMRARILDLGRAVHACAAALLDLARREENTSLPGYTHMRRAMPCTWGMWAAGFAEGLQEELEALPALWDRLDRCPLGAAAGFGPPVPLDRERTAGLLGFSRVQRSPVDVMNSRGRHEQAVAAWVTSAAGTLEKALWDLALFSTEEYGFVRIPEAFTTGSSIMPQKRNPDVVELSRARCRELRGLAAQLAHLSGGLPSSYHRDHQLLKAPFLELVAKGEELFRVFAHLLPGLQIRKEACAAACTRELYAADEASRLAIQGMPFRDAYKVVAAQLKDGSFAPDTTTVLAPLGLDATAAAVAASQAWLGGRQDHLDRTTDQLFQWGNP